MNSVISIESCLLKFSFSKFVPGLLYFFYVTDHSGKTTTCNDCSQSVSDHLPFYDFITKKEPYEVFDLLSGSVRIVPGAGAYRPDQYLRDIYGRCLPEFPGKHPETPTAVGKDYCMVQRCFGGGFRG